MRLPIILLILSLRLLTAYHIQFHPSNFVNYISPTARHLFPTLTAIRQHGHMNFIPLAFFITRSNKRNVRLSIHNSYLIMVILLSNDVQINPGPTHCNPALHSDPPPSAHLPPSSTPPPPSHNTSPQNTSPHNSNNSFLLCTLNVRSLLKPSHSAEIKDLTLSDNPPDLFAFTETWINLNTTTAAEYTESTPPGYHLYSTPRPPISSSYTGLTGGGLAFLTREPSTVLNSSDYSFRSFECASITLKLPSSILTIFNVYRPQRPPKLENPKSVFLQEFTSLLSITATLPHDFLITGDFNIHVDDPSDSFASEFLMLLSSTNLIQHVDFPTHDHLHTLDHVITSSLSNLSPDISSSFDTISDHYPIFTRLNIQPTPRPDPVSHSYRRISSINIETFMQDLSFSDLIQNPPSSLDDLLSLYNTTLSMLLDKHAPIITKSGSHSNNPWYNSYLQAYKSFRRRLERSYKRTRDLQILSALKSATNKYHHLLDIAKKRFYSSLVQSRSSNPRLLWKTINQLLHRNSSSPLPNSLPPFSIAESFCSFFSGKIATLRLSLQSLLSKNSPADTPSFIHDHPPSPPRSSLSIFQPTSETEVSNLLHSLPNKQCELDPIPTSLLKDCASILVPIITKIINLSLSTGNFPLLFKHSLVSPLLKKPSLDKETLSNYRPVSNLSFISKLTERIVLSRINDYLTSNSLLNPHQSGFTKRHSTETLLTSLYNKLVSAISHQQVSCLCLLDISAAFDTIDHNILLQRLSTWFGFTDTALLWIRSYLSSRSFSVKLSQSSSKSCPLTCGVPQGSVLGPLLFVLYTTPLSSLIKSSSVDHHLYADDTQLFISFSPLNFSHSIDHLLHVVSQISSWMTSNLLCLNPTKTEFILIGLRDQLNKIPDPSIFLKTDSTPTHTFTANSPVRNLGVIFDQNLTFSDHITQLSRSCFMHIRDLRRIRPLLDFKTASTIATSIVHTKLDYCNSLFLNIDKTQINRLQAIQNALARAVTKTPKHYHITPVLNSLHWLKIPERIQYKVISLTYNTLQTSQPSYLRQLFTIQPPRSTRSSSALTLLRPSITSSLKFSNRSIAIAVPPIWNELPPELRQISDPSYHLTKSPPLAVSPKVFHSKLKTLLFLKSYPDFPSPPPLPRRSNSSLYPP